MRRPGGWCWGATGSARSRCFWARRAAASGAEGVIFASEIKALLPLVGTVARAGAVEAFLSYRYVPGPHCFFAGIEKLAPGHLAIWQDGTLSLREYWHPPDADPPVADPSRDPASDGPALLVALDAAVQARLVSDAPFGVFLSGGLDSSAIAALMARHCRVRSYAVGFDQGVSELADAALVARHVGAAHHAVTVGAADYPALLPEATRARDAPVSEPTDVALLRLARLAATEVKMVLSGEGADELLGGYPKHRAERLSAAYRALAPEWVRHGGWTGRLPRRLGLALTTMGLEAESDRFARWFGALSPAGRGALLATPAVQVMAPPIAGSSVLRRLFHFDQTSWLPDNLLERGDRIAMAASIETRMPFLDQDLVALVSRWPDARRLNKQVLRAAVAPLLPAHTVRRRKVGFRPPMDDWLRGALRPWLMDLLTGPSSRTLGLYRRQALDAVLAQHQAGTGGHGKLLWSLLALEVFHREYGF